MMIIGDVIYKVPFTKFSYMMLTASTKILICNYLRVKPKPESWLPTYNFISRTFVTTTELIRTTH